MLMNPHDEAPREGIADRRRALRRLSDRVGLQLQHELDAACRISQTLFRSINVDELVQTTLKIALDETDSEAGSILLADAESKQLIFRFVIGEKAAMLNGTGIPWDKGIAGSVFQSREPAVICNVKEDARHLGAVDEKTGFVTRDMITLPLQQWRSDPIGVLTVMNKRGGQLDRRDLPLLTLISAFAALAIQQAHLFEEAKMAEVVRLLGDIGHDLKNLLQPVVSGTWILKEELGGVYRRLATVDAAQATTSQAICDDTLKMIQRTSDRIHDRVKEIADCVKGLSSPPQFAPCLVHQIVEEVFQTLRVVASDKGLSLLSKDLDGLPEIQADARRLYNALYNLINNAIPETPRGGSITVSGFTKPAERHVTVTVADTGRGMPPDVRDRLFTPRAVSTKSGGTGLGTKIVKDVVAAHHGTITVESTVGRGTTFCLRLPLDPRHVEPP
jgi:signal transduction histidine kinase